LQELHRVGTTILGRPRPSRDARPYLKTLRSNLSGFRSPFDLPTANR